MKIKVYVIDVKMPRWIRRALVFGAVPAVILGLGALVYAAVAVPTFTDGAVLTAAPLNQLGQAINDLQAQINSLNGSFASANTNLGNLQTAGSTLQTRISTIEGAYLRTVDTVVVGRPDTVTSGYSDHWDACISTGAATSCGVVASRYCGARGYRQGFWIGENGDATGATHQVACLK